jgi:hypothetical protein
VRQALLRNADTVDTHFRSPCRPSNMDVQRLELYRRRGGDFIERFKADEVLRESNAKFAAEKKTTAEFYEAGPEGLAGSKPVRGPRYLGLGSIDLLGTDMGIIQLLGRDGKLLRVAAQQGFTQDVLESFFDGSRTDDSSGDRALRSGKAVALAVSAETTFDLGTVDLRCRISLPLTPDDAGEAVA